MRVLVAATGRVSHFEPLAPFAEAAEEVLLVVAPELEAHVARLGHPYLIGAAPGPEREAIWREAVAGGADVASILVNREIFGRLETAAMLPALERACAEFAPELVLREPAEYASAVAAERAGIAHAQVAMSLARVEDASLEIAAPALEPYGVVEAIRAEPYVTRFPASLDPSPFPDTRRYRTGPRPHRRPEEPPFVYLTLGTVARDWPTGAAAYRALLDAVDGLPVRALLTGADPPAPVPANVEVRAWVPQHEVLERASVVVCHGGSGTTFGALAAGLPLVFVPLFADQRANAPLVEGAGAGIVAGADAQRIRAAIEAVLADERYGRAAAGIAAEMARAPSVGDVLSSISSR